jgi:hypothetical protein
MPIALQKINNPEVVDVFVSRVPGGPTTDTLFICTGTAVFDFTSNSGPRTDILEFPIPADDGSPLRILRRGVINTAATASLADIDNVNTDNGRWTVDSADIILSDPDEGLILLRITLTVQGNNDIHLRGAAYQANLQVGPE